MCEGRQVHGKENEIKLLQNYITNKKAEMFLKKQ